ncbi:hypothetical protein Lmac_2979 [Legionella maceachernii]|uniref:Uncharacterized protein n=1 Tax=Legionella maceachernii TaxID=466 RepID=A0A0W0VVI4_9GAMM|nr:hypothetical protein Lmac_2979 [Legionella maceachernii]SJZ86314.1 hypothetical protein SAMN02745128_01274 [Legionella maceachernii]SUO99056.1 Uncharacterised protein [Legionella maceachernii]
MINIPNVPFIRTLFGIDEKMELTIYPYFEVIEWGLILRNLCEPTYFSHQTR